MASSTLHKNIAKNIAIKLSQPATAQTLAQQLLVKALTVTAVGGLCLGAIATDVSPAFAQANYPLLASGSAGDEVSQLQSLLKLLGFYQGSIDGSYNQSTSEAVARFQTAAGISADGIAGPSTWQKLLPTPEQVTAVAPPPATPPAAPPAATPPAASAESATPAANSPEVAAGPPVIRNQSVGPAVAQLQRELQALGYYNGEIDGGFGEATQVAVEQFQRDQQLTVDGVVGLSTWDALSEALAQ
jgi:N-acetylmuramoyl-L-alanine amidase